MSAQAPWYTKHPEFAGVALIALAVTQALSLLSFDAAYVHSNWLGLFGYGCGLFWFHTLGVVAYGVIAGALVAGVMIFRRGCSGWSPLQWTALGMATLCTCLVCTLAADLFPGTERFLAHWLHLDSARLGGYPTYLVYKRLPFVNLEQLFNYTGSLLIAFMGLTVSTAYLLEHRLQDVASALYALLKRLWTQPKQPPQRTIKVATPPQPVPTPMPPPAADGERKEQLLARLRARTEKAPSLKAPPALERPTPLPPRRTTAISPSHPSYTLPPIDLLNAHKPVDLSSLQSELHNKAQLLEETLQSFGIEAKVGAIHSGPSITSFEVHPAVGVKVGRIKTLEHDIALNLEAQSIRIIAPIPGKACVGIEVPNKKPQTVSFLEMLSFYQTHEYSCRIPMLLGKNVHGDLVISDLTKMPHCIIAGATGSGKSVCINTIVMSILMTARPDEIKLLMIDPKKVELTAYSELPHMLAPVITEPGTACLALNWLVKEMERRYEILKRTGLRNIEAFNKRTPDLDLEAACGMPIPPKFAYYVTIIDELADLMMAASQDIETPIARIAQMARAVGIHLILATQRPSREVITGLIKANFPSRISFKVASRVNSQIILDDVGAETLLGNGDMLILLPGTSQLVRAQGAFVCDDEITRVIESIARKHPPQYVISSFERLQADLEPGELDDEGHSSDELYNDAKTTVLSTGNASTTFLQRKLKIGYARAASLMDALERNAIVGPQDGAKPRQIFFPTGKVAESADGE